MKPLKSVGVAILFILMISNFNLLHAVDEQRKAYDEMVEEASREADAYVQEKQDEQMEAAQEEQDQPDSELDERIQEERERLEVEMNTVRNRGLGPDFTEGMRESRLRELEEKRSRLDSDPQSYFAGQ